MDSATALSLAAIVVSVVSLVISGYLSLHQARFLRAANMLPVAIELITRDFMQEEFQAKEEIVITQLPQTDPSLGFSGLSEPLRSAAFSVACFYDSLGILVAFGMVDDALVLSTLNYRIRRAWSTMYLHILGERRRRGTDYLDYLEDLSCRAIEVAEHRLGPKLRQVPVTYAATFIKDQESRVPDERGAG